MEFIETPIFTKAIDGLLTPDQFARLQIYLTARPDAGTIIAGGGGIRKLRWALSGRGKSGGIRTIYYWSGGDQLFLLYAYPKNEQENLTAQQTALLRELVKKELL